MNTAAGTVILGAVEGTALSEAEAQFVTRVALSGVTLFSRNVPKDDFRKVDGLTRALQACRGAGTPPLLVAIDQEGGRVARIRNPEFPERGPAMQLEGGRRDHTALAGIESYGRELGDALFGLGINVDFAPCTDILTEPTNDAIGDRCFGTDAEAVTLRSGAFLAGLSAAGVLGCLKHFPGQGDAKVDTHLGGAAVNLPMATLEERELVPYKALLPKAPMVMISHCIYPAIAGCEASRSPKVMKDLLRGKLGYGGVVVSDDMNMGAIPQDETTWQEAIVDAIAAGADLVLVCRHLERCVLAHEAIQRAAAKSPAFSVRLAEAADRVLRLRTRLWKY